MHGDRLLERWLERNTPFVHRTRARSLGRAVDALVRTGTLTLTAIGRALSGSARTKHKIKRVDRLVGNGLLHAQRPDVYGALARWLLSGVERPVILVDWSDCEPGHRWLMLSAALSVRGRAIPIYEEVHPLRRYNSPRTHRRFLQTLATVVPEGCCPIIVTDAGFRGPWFRDVDALGWDWVGRVHNKVKVCMKGTQRWTYTTALYRTATRRIRHLGQYWLSRRQPYAARLYRVKVSRRGPGRPRKANGRGVSARRCRKLYKDPWLQATSLPHSHGSEQRGTKLYAKRMEIEETFRDLKSSRFGFGFELARASSIARRENLLLVAALATFTLWMFGLAARARRWERAYQANTERRTRVLSVIYLACEVVHTGQAKTLTVTDLNEAGQRLRTLLKNQCARA
jgi:hypothetical protein